jgi:integrase
MRTSPVPKYRHHKARDLAVVRIDGKDHYLGKYHSPESVSEYARLIAERFTDRLTASSTGFSFVQIAALYAIRAKKRYKVATANNYMATINMFCLFCDGLDPRDLKVHHLENFQQHLINKSLAIDTINGYLARLRRIFRWAIRNDYLPLKTLMLFDLSERVDATWNNVKQKVAITTVSREHIAAVLDEVPPTVAAMVKFQLHTGCRPGEVRRLRLRDVDQSKAIWEYTPRDHKTSHLGKTHVICIGPQAQKLVEQVSKVADDEFLFHSGSPSTTYTKDSYLRAITRACIRIGIPPWTPNQIRHTVATEIREQYDIEYAQVMLGHSRLQTTEIYAERNMEKAREVAEFYG